MKRFFLLVATLLALGTAVSAQEAATSPWSKGEHSALRLIAGPTSPSGKQRVGIEIVMSPGYKTYWRSPGDFGVPPRFDWSGSVNVGGLDVRWPAPERFPDGAGYSIGYVGEVVIPVSIMPIDPTRPVMLVLKLEYAVCEKICVPATGESQLWLEPGVTSVVSPRLESYETRIPTLLKPGQHKDKPFIAEAKLDEAALEPTLRLLLQVPPEGKVEDIFVEGPGMWSFGKTRLQPEPDGMMLALIKINERPKGVAGPTPFVFTLRGQPKSVESRLELDIPSGKP